MALAVAAAWLYARQVHYGGGELQLGSRYFKSLRARYTVRADTLGVWLYGPPGAAAFRDAGPAGRASSLVAKLRGDDIEWPLIMDDDTGEFFVSFDGPRGGWLPPYTVIDALPDAEKV